MSGYLHWLQLTFEIRFNNLYFNLKCFYLDNILYDV